MTTSQNESRIPPLTKTLSVRQLLQSTTVARNVEEKSQGPGSLYTQSLTTAAFVLKPCLCLSASIHPTSRKLEHRAWQVLELQRCFQSRRSQHSLGLATQAILHLCSEVPASGVCSAPVPSKWPHGDFPSCTNSFMKEKATDTQFPYSVQRTQSWASTPSSLMQDFHFLVAN